VNRRDFLMFRRQREIRVLDLSCERLYMAYLDAKTGAARMAHTVEAEDTLGCWTGEPPTVTRQQTCDELLRDLRTAVEGVDVVRIHGSEWLANEEFREDFKNLLAAVSARGGKVEYAEPTGVTSATELD
jgi:hypothetical protein